MFSVLVLVLIHIVTAQDLIRVTHFGQPFVFNCPYGYTLGAIGSDFSEQYKDRRYDFECSSLPDVVSDHYSCTWSGYFHEFTEDFDYTCGTDTNPGFIAGVGSYHRNQYEDRRYKFYCCTSPTINMTCNNTPWASVELGLPFDELLASGQIVNGVSSTFSHGRQDRQFDFFTCTLQ